VGRFALLYRLECPLVEGVAKNNSQGGGSLAAVGRLALLCRLESPLVEGVAKDFLKTTPKGLGALLLWVGLLFCVGWICATKSKDYD
jgi:hypothetical protein